MQEAFQLSRVCATALLDAYCKNDAPQMSEIAVEAQLMSTFYATNAAESERLEVLGGIAVELLRSSTPEHADNNLDPYVRLLLHLARPDLIETVFDHHN
jgi:hypothetical protein